MPRLNKVTSTEFNDMITETDIKDMKELAIQQPESAPQLSVGATLAQRGVRYGRFLDHAYIAQTMKDVMWATQGWPWLAYDQRQALEVVVDKIARILNGDPNYTDNWHDIQGYAKLVEDRLNEEQKSGVGQG